MQNGRRRGVASVTKGSRSGTVAVSLWSSCVDNQQHSHHPHYPGRLSRAFPEVPFCRTHRYHPSPPPGPVLHSLASLILPLACGLFLFTACPAIVSLSSSCFSDSRLSSSSSAFADALFPYRFPTLSYRYSATLPWFGDDPSHATRKCTVNPRQSAAALGPSGKMTCNITTTPLNVEPLPLYRRDPETSSVLSSAPSYSSEAPTYSSRRPSVPATLPSLLPPLSQITADPNVPHGLPAHRYARGFQNRALGNVGDPESHLHSYNSNNWSNLKNSNNSRQYQAVANRRANQAASLGQTSSGSTTNVASQASASASAPTAMSPASSATASNTGNGLSPLEDPYLVGETAARRAKSARVYREMCLRGEDAILYEGRTWDFMLIQTVDWEERERSWKNFHNSLNKRKLLVPGLRGLRGIRGFRV